MSPTHSNLHKRIKELQVMVNSLQQAQQVVHLGSWHLDLQGNGLSWSDETYRIFGVADNSPLSYEDFLERIHPDDRMAVEDSWQAALQGAPYDITHRIIVDGQIKWVRERAELLFGDDGALLGGIGTVQDISEQVQASWALQKSEQRLRMLFERNGDAILLLQTSQAMYIDANPAALTMLQCSREELIGMSPELLSPEYQPDGLRSNEKAALLIEQAIRDGSCRFEWTHRSPRRPDFPVEVLLTPIEEGATPQMIVTWRDITERKLSELQYKTIIETAMDGFWVNDMNGRFLDVNPAYTRMIGYSREELLGMGISDVETIEHPEDIRKRIERLIAEGHDQFETVHRHKNGSLIELEVSANYLPIANGRITAFLRDISLRKQAEAAMQLARQAAEDANRTKSEFLANMSHEIRTPMNAIMGLTRLVLETNLSPRQEEFLRKAYDSSRALLNILNDILDYSKIEAGHLEISRLPFSIEETLGRVADLFSPQIAEKQLELFLELAPGVPERITGDQLRLTQVLNNLMSNAVKFTETGSIHLKVTSVRQEGSSHVLQFAVRDTGIGLSKDQTERLFQPFTQADSSITRHYGGTGLGLAISRRLVELMGGTITVSSAISAGATFSFTIQAEAAEPVGQPRNLQQLRHLKVLAVDDQQTSLEILLQILQSWGIEACSAQSGEQALAAIHEAEQRQDPFDLLLIDWRMPGLDGLQVVKRLEEELAAGAISKSLQIIMVTAYDREELLAKAATLQLDGVLTKPVFPSHLFDLLVNNPQSLHLPEDHACHNELPDLTGIRILLVEDNLINREVAAELLKKSHALIFQAIHGGEAVEALQRQPFDLVLMDLHMPVMDGLEATRRIRKLPNGIGLPIIAMTAAVMQEDRERCMNVGMDDFVAKPIDPDDLTRAIRRSLKRYQSARSLRQPARSDDSALHLSASPFGFNLEAALKRVNGNRNLLSNLLLAFADEQQESGQRLHDLLASRAVDDALLLLHTLKGVAGSLGAEQLAQVTAQLEQELKQGGELPSMQTFTATLTETLLTINRQIIPALQQALAQHPPAATDRTELRAALLEISRFLQEQELIPDNLQDILNRETFNDLPGQPLTRLQQQILNFDHSGALETVASLLAGMNGGNW